MTDDDLRQLLIDIRDTNRQLVSAQQEIAQSFKSINEMWARQMASFKYTWLYALLPLLVLIPLFWTVFNR
jgi:hypothetical protein